MKSQDEVPQQIRWGIVGPGHAGTRFAEGLAEVQAAELSIVCGRSPERARAYAHRFNVPRVTTQLDDLLAGDVDAVYVATNPDSHAQICLSLLTAGKHVLCEKPATLSSLQLEKVLATARRQDRLFMEAMKPPFFPLYRRLRSHLASDPIGPVGFVRAGHSDSARAGNYPIHTPELGGGGIMAIGPYEAFLALDWLGSFKQMQCMGRLSPVGVDNFALFQTEHERGMAQLHTGFDLLSRGDALLSGPRGYVLLHANWWNPSHATIYYVDGRIVELHEPYFGGGFNYETDHFCELIRGGLRESPEISHQISLDMARLLESARHNLGVHFPGETDV
jgi:scyllo-inositol 2-dehydrogenase (NADP+)